MTERRPPADQPARQRIVHERQRNVVVIAGAGTGKTKTIIDRAVELLAPSAPDAVPVPIQRMAAITFTRRAAGELRFRLRERLLRELEHAARSDAARSRQLRDALGTVDAAFIGTIHGFADRLLRLRPVEADLSPSYTLVEENGELVRETLLRLQRAAELGTLRQELDRHGQDLSEALVDEAAATLRLAAQAGVPIEKGQGYAAAASVEEMLAHMIETRDVDLEAPRLPDPGLDAAYAAAGEFSDMVAKIRGGSVGAARLRRVARALDRLPLATDPAAAIRVVNDALRGRQLYLGRDFQNDSLAWGIYKTIHPEKPQGARIFERLQGPHRWLATRLVRLAPVACAMYARVKAEHEVVDYLDLLIKLRDLLRHDAAARRFYQSLFDHLFVDEFQDTDPLQCEIVFYLCGDDHAVGGDVGWDELPITPGKLTIVGDPKQSIYRFRRADIAMYGRAVERLQQQGATRERLGTNFRSTAQLLHFFNEQLGRLLGRDTRSFDPATGRASYEDLAPAQPGPPDLHPVHVLPYADDADSGLLAGPGRAVEARMLARYIRWLLASDQRVRDLDSGEERPIRPGDIAVLACVTTNLSLLLRELDRLDVTYTARGGSLFVSHPVVRQFLLALRALADRDDGVAEAALLQPPFFALDWDDHVAALVHKKEPDERRLRVEAARDLITQLRRRRHARSPGATARDVIECTGLGRTVAATRNGEQTLLALYEIAHEADRRASLGHLDFDATSEFFREWAAAPVYLETPEPIGSDAVRVATMHGAKGLEFPVVILWDGFQTLDTRASNTWHVERDGRGWALGLGPIAVEHPAPGLLERERRFGTEERRRMYYVAATRARDLLVVPLPTTKGRLEYANASLVAAVDMSRVRLFDTFRPGQPPAWARLASEPRAADWVSDAALDAQAQQRVEDFHARVQRARAPVAVPVAVTGLAHAGEEDAPQDERRRKAATARFGTEFGLVVHRALELLLEETGTTAPEAVAIAGQEIGYAEQRDDAIADVQRAVDGLRQAGLLAAEVERFSEFPVVRTDAGQLLSGYIDLLCIHDDWLAVVDFKTDTPIDGPLAESHPAYARQLELYGEMLRAAGLLGRRTLRLGVLFSSSGALRWHEPTAPRDKRRRQRQP